MSGILDSHTRWGARGIGEVDWWWAGGSPTMGLKASELPSQRCTCTSTRTRSDLCMRRGTNFRQVVSSRPYACGVRAIKCDPELHRPLRTDQGIGRGTHPA